MLGSVRERVPGVVDEKPRTVDGCGAVSRQENAERSASSQAICSSYSAADSSASNSLSSLGSTSSIQPSP